MSEKQSEAEQNAAPVDEGETLEWTCHPMKRRPLTTILVMLFVMVVGAGVYSWTESRVFAVFALVVLLASLARFFFPTSYRLSDRRITIKTVTQTLHKDWEVYRTSYPDKNGILLSPFVQPSRLENFRGLYLLFNNNRDEVGEFVNQRLGRKIEKPDTAENEESAKS